MDLRHDAVGQPLGRLHLGFQNGGVDVLIGLIQAPAFGADGQMGLKCLLFGFVQKSVNAEIHVRNIGFAGSHDLLPPFF